MLGRLTSRAESEGTSTWVYDTRNKGIGKLARVSRGDYLEEHFYDALGRTEQTRITIAGASYSLTTGYDLLGRPDTLIYPTGFSVRTLYNAQGYPQELRRASDNQPLWQAGTINARGQLEQATLGNGLVTTRDFDPETGRVERIRAGSVQDLSFTCDALGNLQTRRDDMRGLSETFGYDMLNRLTSSQVAGRAAVTITYDALGNIASKSDVGIYTYGESGTGPHAVTSIVGAKGGAYSYDANGNLVHRQLASSSPTTIAYTSFNKPASITEGTTTLSFAYGPQHERYRQVVTTSSGGTTKLYIGGIFERETTGATVRNIHYIRAGGEVFAVYITEGTGAATLQSTRYLHRDHLGSVHTITSETGTVVEVLAFDPWGVRRNAQDWSPATAPITSTIDRGFTGHEHLDEVSLIHMNGRVYDPVIGRFLSADPFVQVPEFSQSLNRYSYVFNNPLSATDPSGYFFKGLFLAVRSVVQDAVGFVSNNLYTIAQLAAVSTGNVWAIAGTNFAISVHAGIQSGAGFDDILRSNIRSAVISRATAFAFNLAGDYFEDVAFGSVEHLKKIIAHGAIGGISGVAQGGKFEHGFLSASVTQAFAPGIDMLDKGNTESFQRVLAAAVVGGTAEEVGGGKFANGAITGAFSRMFNDESPHGEQGKGRMGGGRLSRDEIEGRLARIPGCVPGTPCNSVRVWNRIFAGLGVGDGVAANLALHIIESDRELATSTSLYSHAKFQATERLALELFYDQLSPGEKVITKGVWLPWRIEISYLTSWIEP